MVRALEFSVVVIAGGSLSVVGLYLGFKLARFRPHRKSEEVQTAFSRNRLD